MTPEITAALITGLFGLAAACLPAILPRVRRMYRLRRTAAKGTEKDEPNPDEPKSPAR